MGRKYYCDYCDKRLPEGRNHRQKHNKAIQHIQNQRKYYRQFQDSTEIFLEERSKRMCNQWNQTGLCSFGDNCKYSHRSNYQLIQLIHPVSFDVQRWIEKKLVNQIIVPESLIS